MTRKDFELIAAIIRRAGLDGPACITRVKLAADMADALRATNDRFDYGRFMEAATGMKLPKPATPRSAKPTDCSNTLTGGQCFDT